MPRSKGRPSCRSLPSPSLRECGAGAAPKSKRRGRSRSASRSVVAAHLQQESGGAGDREDRPRSNDVQRGTSSKNSQHGKYPTGKGRHIDHNEVGDDVEKHVGQMMEIRRKTKKQQMRHHLRYQTPEPDNHYEFCLIS
ncbi:protein BEX4-like [Phocoena sinus]|uniref:protein BEX4-like n=1 Tax=Phocoena sinus TaxID=42100 RepID=UPI0013C46F0F|nr:protein BEX4-like [Phocoena sinus]